MHTHEDYNVAPANDGYKLMKNVANYCMAVMFLSAVALGFIPKEHVFIRMLAFGVQMLLLGVIVGNKAQIWSRPKLARVRETKY